MIEYAKSNRAHDKHDPAPVNPLSRNGESEKKEPGVTPSCSKTAMHSIENVGIGANGCLLLPNPMAGHSALGPYDYLCKQNGIPH
jgi:hypothetical protein